MLRASPAFVGCFCTVGDFAPKCFEIIHQSGTFSPVASSGGGADTRHRCASTAEVHPLRPLGRVAAVVLKKSLPGGLGKQSVTETESRVAQLVFGGPGFFHLFKRTSRNPTACADHSREENNVHCRLHAQCRSKHEVSEQGVLHCPVHVRVRPVCSANQCEIRCQENHHSRQHGPIVVCLSSLCVLVGTIEKTHDQVVNGV